MVNYYKILGITKLSTDDEIKNAYKKLALKWHPDKNKNKNTEIKFQNIIEAYNILGNIDKRKQYDEDELNKNKSIKDTINITKQNKSIKDTINITKQNNNLKENETKQNNNLKENETKQFNNISPNTGTTFTTTINGLPVGTSTNGMPDLDALFRQIFGSNNMFNGIGNQVEQVLNNISKTKIQESNTNEQSPLNKRPPPPTVHELYCTLEDLYNGIEKTLLIRDEYNKVELDVEIQSGTKDETKIRFFKKGPSKEDVIIIVKTKNHNIFKREINDLHITLDLTIDEAKNGCTKSIKMIDGTECIIKINKLKKTNDIQKVIGYGMIIKGSKKKGDLFIHFNVSIN
jgi:DnaJ family protein B protein 11